MGNEVTTADLVSTVVSTPHLLRGWGFEVTVETRPRGNGDDSGGWGLMTTLKTKGLGSGYDSGDFVAGDWRQKWSFSAS